MRPWIATALTASALAAGWMYLTLSGAVSDLFLPPPRELWDALLDLLQNGYKSRPLWEHVADSLIRVFAGFGLGAAVGMPMWNSKGSGLNSSVRVRKSAGGIWLEG